MHSNGLFFCTACAFLQLQFLLGLYSSMSACHWLVSCNIVHMIVSFHAVRSCLQVCSVLKAW